MTEIQIIGKFGKKVCKPFVVNTVPEAIAEEDQIINSESTVSDNQEETTVAEESC